MVDTVRLSTSGLILDPDHLARVGLQHQRFSGRSDNGHWVDRERWVTVNRQDAAPYLRYVPYTGALTIEASLPKVLWGQNVRLLGADEVRQSLDRLTDIVSDTVGVQVPACTSWDVQRVDYCFNWQVGEASRLYLPALAGCTLPYLRTIVDSGTVYFANRRRVVRFYDKFRESHRDDAKGILRFEVELRRPEDQLRDLVCRTTADEVLCWSVARPMLGGYLDRLGSHLVVDRKTVNFEKLLATYGYPKAERLMGYMHVRGICGSAVGDVVGSRTTVYRRERELREAGIDADMAEGRLPPLTLPDEFDGEAGVIKSVV